MNTITKDLEEAGLVIPTTSPLNALIGPVQRADGSWRMIMDYCKLNQVGSPIAAVD
jgi:hypothetical protein